MDNENAMDEDWELLVSMLPQGWKGLAEQSGALKGLRKDKSAENLLRVLLLHVGCGFSLRETVLRARLAKLAQLSDVALLKRLRKSKEWLYGLCCALFEQRGLPPSGLEGKAALRLVDATVVKEPGKTGSLWRIHYSFQWPALKCDYFKITATHGKGSAETLKHYPIEAQDHIIVDRGYCRAEELHFVAAKKAYLMVRLNPDGIVLQNEDGSRVKLLEQLKAIKKTGQIQEWEVFVPYQKAPRLKVRLCLIRKTQTAISLAQKKLRRCASRDGRQLQPSTLRYAEYVMVLTTFPQQAFEAKEILQGYRYRWQIELIFKRFKQIAQLGHLPKYDDDSAKSWLYAKLLVALLSETLIEHASAFSPWGYRLEKLTHPQPVA